MKPLDGVRVLDLTRLLPGAVATMLLADFGAEVIKIEEPGAGDPARSIGSGAKGGARAGRSSPVFLATNRNKRSVVIDLKREDGRALFLRLAESADVVIEGFRPGVMQRLHLDYETLSAINPRLVYCALTGYGQNGPYRLEAGHDINYISIAGLLGLNGERGGPPIIPGVQIADLAGGSLQAVIGILLALLARAQTGRGQMVDVSMMDGALSMMIVPLSMYFASGRMPERGAELLSGRYACYHIYETKDGRHLALGALEAKFWANACELLGRADLIPEQWVEGERQQRLIETLGGIFRTRTAAEWIEAAAGRDLCLTLIKDPGEALEDPQVVARGLITEIDHPTEGRMRQIAPYIKLSETPGEVTLPPPRLGEHTRAVLEENGLSTEEIDQMLAAGIIAAAD